MSQDLPQALEDLRRSEERYRSFVANSTETIWCIEFQEPIPLDLPEMEQLDLCYRHARIVEANEVFATVYAASREEVIGWRLENFLPRALPTSVPFVLEVIRSGYRMRDSESVERAADGEERIFLNSSTCTVADGKLLRVWGTSRDITDLRSTERKLRLRQQELEKLKDRLAAEADYLREEIRSDHNYQEIVGRSPAIRGTLDLGAQVAVTDSTVLLLGETGSGKELLARFIHSRSRRSGHPLIKVDCSTLPPGLVESELFGHQKGAFTGAHEAKAGRFELAHRGTIFLDEIGELPLDLQAKLLRVLQEGEIQRVGAKQPRRVDLRVIAATNRDLKAEMEAGRFRSDLYYRVSVFPVECPPLRRRREDVPLLASFFITRYAAAMNKRIESVDPASLEALVAYDWPGNVRELQNVIERSVILCQGRVLSVAGELGGASTPAPFRGDAEPSPPPGPSSHRGAAVANLKQDLHAVERARILAALEQSGWKIKGVGNAAGRLGLSPSTLRSRMKRLKIERP